MLHVWCHKSIVCSSPCRLVKRFLENPRPPALFEGWGFKNETLEPVGFCEVTFLVFVKRSENWLVTCNPVLDNVKLLRWGCLLRVIPCWITWSFWWWKQIVIPSFKGLGVSLNAPLSEAGSGICPRAIAYVFRQFPMIHVWPKRSLVWTWPLVWLLTMSLCVWHSIVTTFILWFQIVELFVLM